MLASLISIVDSILVFAAFIANILAIVAVSKSTSRTCNYRMLLISLLVSNVYASIVNGAIVFLKHYMDKDASPFSLEDSNCVAHVTRRFACSAFFSNILNMAGLAIDHLHAVLYPYSYKNENFSHAKVFFPS